MEERRKLHTITIYFLFWGRKGHGTRRSPSHTHSHAHTHTLRRLALEKENNEHTSLTIRRKPKTRQQEG